MRLGGIPPYNGEIVSIPTLLVNSIASSTVKIRCVRASDRGASTESTFVIPVDTWFSRFHWA
jgi:hypothetical protein